jgi:hypothetical protein
VSCMTPATCGRCSDLQREVVIDSPGKLRDLIRVVQKRLAEGALEERRSQEPFASSAPFNSVPKEGPWPDYLLYTFQCTSCDSRFRLESETYHGAGGRWSWLNSAQGSGTRQQG